MCLKIFPHQRRVDDGGSGIKGDRDPTHKSGQFTVQSLQIHRVIILMKLYTRKMGDVDNGQIGPEA
uniref:Uncharacterized protein n=1 Tax=Timema bartmani TaxID=61472 RepID=A0A7R9F313_9NEOP|nr:unnamed protein product [Timema bartmani]